MERKLLKPRREPPFPFISAMLMQIDPPVRYQDVSVWRMELPDEAYMAPHTAFWWVSNERKA